MNPERKKKYSEEGLKAVQDAARKAHTTHGMKGTREYNSWRSMLDRCQNENDPFYARYGGRGIRVCEGWLKFEAFFADMGARPEGQSLDRKDSDGPYSKANCRWATAKEQQRNRSTNRLVEINGKTMALVEWCEVYGINKSTVSTRLRQGWSEVDAITLPLKRAGNAGNKRKGHQ